MRLENRLLFDAAAAPVALDAAIAHHVADTPAASTQNHGVDHSDASALQAALPQAILDLHTQPHSVNLLVISSSIPDSQSIVDAAKAGVTTLYYDPSHTSLAQLQAKIAEVLHGQQADSIAFVTEGTKGQIDLTDGLIVNTQALQQNSAIHAFWQSVGSMIKSGGELNLLGCNVAQGTQGMTFLQVLSQTIQHGDGQAISVNASIDSTGSLQDGGNWILEKGSSTPIDAASLYFDQTITNWNHLLQNPVANDDHYQIYENGSIFNTYNLGDNDTLGQNAGFALDSLPTKDSYFKWNTDGTFTYIASPYASGTDHFTYHIVNSDGTSNVATVTIDINALNNAPVAINAEVITVPFNDANGVTTTGIYSGLVNITVTGVGISRGDQPSDAFYVFSNESDLSSYFRDSGPIHVFLIDGNLPNVSLPGPTSTHSYTFTVDVGAAHQLVLSENDVIFTDNFGYYKVTISPVNTGIVETSNENAGPITISPWATNLSVGLNANGFNPPNSSNFLHFNIVGNTNPGLFSSLGISVNGDQASLSYTSAPNASGTAVISYTISDNGGTLNGGVDTSPVQTFTIVINPVNNAPSFTGGANQVQNEAAVNTSYTVSNWATNINPGAPDEAGQALAFHLSYDNPSLFSTAPTVDANGNLHYSIAAYANGVSHISVSLSDNGGTANGGQDTSGIYNFTITSNFVNQAPSFEGGANQVKLETPGDTSYTIANWATNINPGAPNETGQALTFNLTYDNPSLFSSGPTIDANGHLHYSIAAYANGTSHITVTLNDNGGTANGGIDASTSHTFTITALFVNQAPSFEAGTSPVQLETPGITSYTVANWATQIYSGAPNEADQTFTFHVTYDNPSLFSTAPTIDANGNLHYSIAAYANGVSHITVSLSDSGGTLNGGIDTSISHSFTITALFVNQAPSFTPGVNQTAIEDSGSHVINWATQIYSGAPNETTQTIHFSVVSDNPSLFSEQPTVNSQGVLTYQVAQGASGIANIRIVAQDDGGTANGGINQSEVQSFTINVVGVHSQVISDGPSGINGGNILTSSPDANNALTFTLIQGPQHAVSFLLDPSGQFNYKPIPGYNGADGYTYQVTDANGQVLETRTVNIIVANNFLAAPPNNVIPYVPPPSNPDSIHTNNNSSNGSNGEVAVSRLFTETYPSSSEATGLLHESITNQNVLLSPLQNAMFNEGRSVEAKDLSLSSNDLEIKQVALQETEVLNLPKMAIFDEQWNISSFARVPEMAIPTAAAFFFSVIHEGFTQDQSRITPIEKAAIAEEQESRILAERVRSAVGYQVILLESPKFAEQFNLSNTGIFTYHPKEGFKGEDSFTFQIVTQLGLVASVAKISIQIDDKAVEKAKSRTAPPKYALKYGFAGKRGFTYQADLSFLGKDTFQYAHGDSMTKVQMEISPANSQLLTEKLLQEQKLVISSLQTADQTPAETSGDVKSLATSHMVQVSKQQFVQNANGHFEQKNRSQFWQLAG